MEYNIPADVLMEAEMNSLESDQILTNTLIKSVSQSVKETRCENNLPDPIDYLKKVMERRELRNKDLKIYIGSSGNVCSVLKRRKPLTLRMIRNLHQYLDIPAEILIQPYKCK